jgi:uncharacterized membrane protein
MNWILGIIGAFVGGALTAGEAGIGGAVLGFCVAFALGKAAQLNGRLKAAEAEVEKLRQFAVWYTAQQERAAPAPQAARPAPVAPAAPAATAPPVATEPAPTPASTSSVAEPAPAPTAPTAVREGATPPVERAVFTASEPRAPEPPKAPPPPRPRAPVAPAGPNAVERALSAVQRWFTEGNVPVKVGVLVLFAGVAAALRYAVAEGFISFPIELRYAAIAALGVAALAFGWRERANRAFGLSLQGGGIGILMLTVFAAYRLHPLLPAGLAFGLVVLLVAGAAMLAILQDAMALAVLGFLGGYLAPVLISTGSGNHVALFSYYAVLNTAVFLVSWKRAWRLLNLVGFAFTFGVGTAWGLKYYQPAMFATVEPFLILFFVFYVVIGLLYVLRQTEHRRPWVDGSLVFGTPLLAFPLQAGLLKDDRMGLAFSALAVALVYLGLLFWLRNRQRERLLTEAYGALAIGFATLAVPLAFSAGTTASVWALEGAGIAWIGLRQNRWFPWLAGLLLQGLAAISYVIYLDGLPGDPYGTDTILLLNAPWLGAAIIALAGFALSFMHERLRNVFGLPPVLFVWASAWWMFACLTQMDRAEQTIGAWQFLVMYLAITAAIAALLRERMAWPRLNWLVGGMGALGFVMVPYAQSEFRAPLQPEALPGWGVFAAAMTYALWQGRAVASRSLCVAHLALLYSLALALSLQLEHVAIEGGLGEGWQILATLAPPALLSLGLWRAPATLAWPRASAFERYAPGWFVPVFALFGIAWIVGVFSEGDAMPLVYLPLLNPLELAIVGISALVYAYAKARWPRIAPALNAWPFAAFVFVTLATLRAVHHLHGEPWGSAVLDSGFSQTALTLVWSVIAVGAWVYGSKRVNRPVWVGGAVLIGIVLLKLILVDRTYMGNLSGIVSFFAVGLLMVGVGYVAPAPPRQTAAPAPAPSPQPSGAP